MSLQEQRQGDVLRPPTARAAAARTAAPRRTNDAGAGCAPPRRAGRAGCRRRSPRRPRDAGSRPGTAAASTCRCRRPGDGDRLAGADLDPAPRRASVRAKDLCSPRAASSAVIDLPLGVRGRPGARHSGGGRRAIGGRRPGARWRGRSRSGPRRLGRLLERQEAPHLGEVDLSLVVQVVARRRAPASTPSPPCGPGRRRRTARRARRSPSQVASALLPASVIA